MSPGPYGFSAKYEAEAQQHAQWAPNFEVDMDASTPSTASQMNDWIRTNTKAVLRVGTGSSQQIYHVDRDILFGSSALVRPHSCTATDIDLPDEDPIVAEMFVTWAKTPQPPIVYVPGQYSDEPWISNAAPAWLFGHHLDAAMFQQYALSQFIQNCAMVLRGPWKWIEETAPAGSPLRRFSNHWVAWDSCLSGSDLNEYTDLDAVKHTGQVRPSTRDPRKLDLIHWYLDCGNDINAQCDHDPIFRANRRREERLKKKKPSPLTGVEYELAATNTTGGPVHTRKEPLVHRHGTDVVAQRS
ncbi:MAG: hypothetical protein Q9168_002267 [Polycauliona sp. 1 TL-2023]